VQRTGNGSSSGVQAEYERNTTERQRTLPRPPPGTRAISAESTRPTVREITCYHEDSAPESFEHWTIGYLSLFRASDFGFRIWRTDPGILLNSAPARRTRPTEYAWRVSALLVMYNILKVR
jgi:hypothetical protein